MRELAFNVSEKLLKSNSKTFSQYHYLLNTIREQNTDGMLAGDNSNESDWIHNVSSDKCLAVVPSTETWVFIDCSKSMNNITFLCQYSNESEKRTLPEYVPFQTYKTTAHCTPGWNPFGEECLKIKSVRLNVVRDIDELESACKDINGYLFTYSHIISEYFILYIQSILKEGFHLVVLKSQKQKELIVWDISTANVEYDKIRLLSVTLPLHIPIGVSLKVICSQNVKIVHGTCMEGFSVCNNEECIPQTYLCDGVYHCSNGEDETNCDFNPCDDTYENPLSEKLYFKCDGNDTCIAISRVCDLLPDCNDASDEAECPDFKNYIPTWSPLVIKGHSDDKCLISPSGILSLEHESFLTDSLFHDEIKNYGDIDIDQYMCPIGSAECYPIKYLCTLDKDIYGNELPCKNTWHYGSCHFMIQNKLLCGEKFKCNSYDICVPLRLVCNGKPDCPNGEEEADCETFSCPKMLRCTKEKICVHPSEICDGVLHCPLSGDDEVFCPDSKCPVGCKCLGRAMFCTKLMEVLTSLDYAIVILRLDVARHYFGFNLSKAWFIDVSSCNIISIEQLRKIIIPNVVKLNLNNNSLYDFSTMHLTLKNLKFLDMEKSSLSIVRKSTFQGLHNLERLNLANSEIYSIGSCSFCSLKFLKTLDISNSYVVHLTLEAFTGLEFLRFNISVIKTISKSLLHSISIQNPQKSIKLCCLQDIENVHYDHEELCRSFAFSIITRVCPFSYPADNPALTISFVFIIVLQCITSTYLFFIKKKHNNILKANQISSIILLTILLIFHFNNLSQNNSMLIDFQSAETVLCKSIALSMYVLYFLYPLSNSLYFLQMYLKVKHALDSKKHLETRHCIYILATGIVVIWLVAFLFSENGAAPSALCLMQFKITGKYFITAIGATLGLVLFITIILSLRQIRKSRETSGRSKSDFEQQLQIRFHIYIMVVLTAFLIGIPCQLELINNVAIHVYLLYCHLLIMPITFSVLFILSTKQFRVSLRTALCGKGTNS